MKKKLMKIGMALVGLFFLVGAACCILRPDYTNEALEILFENELEVNDISEEDLTTK